MPKENNKMQVDIENLIKQNVNDLSAIKELYIKLKEIEEKLTQIRYIDSNLAYKLKKEYENLKRVILDENIQVKLTNDIESINSQMDTIIKQGFVSYEQFGAILDGRDITDIAKTAHEFANEYGLIVRQNKGSFKISDTIYVKTNVDLSGSEIIIDDNTPNVIQYYIKSNEDYKNINITQSELKEGATNISSLSSYKNSFIKIVSSEVFAKRIDGNDYAKQETLVHVSDGFILGGELQNNFTSGNITIQAKSILDNPVTFIPPTVRFKRTDMSLFNTLISCTRSNTTIKNLIINSDELPNFNSSIYKGCLISLHDCYNTTIENFTSENLSAKATTSTQPTYILGVDNIINARFTNINILRGWGCIGTHYVKDLIFENSHLNRIDNHIGCGNIDIRNCTIIGGYGIYLGWGKGIVNIQNCKSIYDNTHVGGNSSKSCILLRTDWGTPFEGILNVFNHTIVNNTANLEKLGLVALWDNGRFDYLQSRTLKLGKINIDGVNIINNIDTVIYGLQIGLTQYMSNLYTNKITIKNVSVINESDSNYFKAFAYNSTNDYLRNIDIDLINIKTKLIDKYINGFSEVDFADMNNLRNMKNIVFIYAPNSTALFNINIDKCEGNLYASCINTTYIKDSIISCLFVGGTNCQLLSINNCELYPSTSDTGWSTILPCHNANIRNSIVNGVKRNGTYVGMNLENLDNAKLLLNNMLVGKNEVDIAYSLAKTVSAMFVQ